MEAGIDHVIDYRGSRFATAQENSFNNNASDSEQSEGEEYTSTESEDSQAFNGGGDDDAYDNSDEGAPSGMGMGMGAPPMSGAPPGPPPMQGGPPPMSFGGSGGGPGEFEMGAMDGNGNETSSAGSYVSDDDSSDDGMF
jgi:hypothetical protein